jgi:hypothetical protein
LIDYTGGELLIEEQAMRKVILLVSVILTCSIVNVSYAAVQKTKTMQPQKTAKMLLIKPAKQKR